MRKIKIISHGTGKKESYKNYGFRRVTYTTKAGKKVTYTYGTRTTTRSSKLVVKDNELTEYGKEIRDLMVSKLGKPFEAKVDEVLSGSKELKESTFMAKMENALEQAESKSLDGNDKSANKKDKKPRSTKARIRTFIYNMGGDVQDLANDLGLTKDELLNPKNWVFVNSEEAYLSLDGYKYSFYFKYEENEIRWKRSLV